MFPEGEEIRGKFLDKSSISASRLHKFTITYPSSCEGWGSMFNDYKKEVTQALKKSVRWTILY